MPKTKHKYRVTIYLGKRNYEELKRVAEVMNVSISTLARLIYDTGHTLSKMQKEFDDLLSMKGGVEDGNK